MFGYVIIDKPNILIKDYQTYRGYYCGICKAIGKRSGHAMRMTLNYDLVVLALIAHNYENTEPEFAKAHCPVHPVGRKILYAKNSGIFSRISDINTILCYYKLFDDVADENKHKLIMSAVRPYYKKAEKRMAELAKRVSFCYNNLREKEKVKAEITVLSDCFGELMIAVAESLTQHCDNILRELCFYLGKWVYIIDAADDIIKDGNSGSFNPFLQSAKESGEAVYDEIEPSYRYLTNECIDKITAAYEKMNITVSEGALSNIIYMGLRERTDYIMKKRGQKCQKIRL